jgi:hypothetical protein
VGSFGYDPRQITCCGDLPDCPGERDVFIVHVVVRRLAGRVCWFFGQCWSSSVTSAAAVRRLRVLHTVTVLVTRMEFSMGLRGL